MKRNFGGILLLVLAGLMLLPAVAVAQSQITGVARDESGGVLPGVTVEASSPVLIEKVRSAVTDDQGRYTIANLRPGMFRIAFTLPGFNTVIRDGVEVPGGVTVTANADLKVGALEETITVSGQTPLVDVTQATRTQVLTRDLIDALPSTRNIMSVGMMVPGIRLGTPDVGGSRQMEQTNPRGHGIAAKHTVQHIDGMSVNSQETSNQQSYINDALSAEVTVSTSAHPAEIQSGGLRTNMIPKDGGNVVSGSIFMGGTDGSWQSDNVNDEMRRQNFTSANGIAHIQNFNASMGGPIQRDKLWFFISARHISTDELVGNVPEHIVTPDGEFINSTLDQYIRDVLARLTYQVNSTNKLSAFFERTWKRKGKDFGFGTDPRAGTQRDPNLAHYGVGQIKWLSTMTNRILVEGGYSSSYQHWTGFNQPAVRLDRYLANGTINPAWLNNARRESPNALVVTPRCAYSFGCNAWVSNGQDQRTADAGHRLVGSFSYVTGSHNFKVGFADSFGPVHVHTDRQADLVQRYSNGRPQSVVVYTTPYDRFSYVNYDMGIYAQDSWTFKRLTLSPGVRVDNFDSMIEATSMPAGRFAGDRYFPERKHVPQWLWDVSPRFSGAYDLFGDGRTALKASFSRYIDPLTGGFADRYAPGAGNETRNWFDCTINAAGSACATGVPRATDNDDIAQAHEIGPGGATFGIREDRYFDPDLQRERNTELTAGVQHQLFSRMSLTAQYYRRTFQDLENLDRELITHADYTSFQVPLPDVSRDVEAAGVISSGQPVTVFNLRPQKLSVYTSQQRDKTNQDLQSTYNGLDLALTARLAGGGIVFGSWTVERNISKFCANNDNPNGVGTADRYTGANVSAGGRFCDQGAFDLPLRHEFKMAGSYNVGWGVDLGAVLQSYAGSERRITWEPAAALFPGGRTRTENITLNEPGSLFYPRYNQLDFNVKKSFRAGRKTYSGQIDWFNILNGNAVFSRNSAVGASLGQIQTILQGRLVRLAFQMKF